MTTNNRPLPLQALRSTGLACTAAMALLVLAGCAGNGTPDTPPRYEDMRNKTGTHDRVLLEHMYAPEGSPFRRAEHGRN